MKIAIRADGGNKIGMGHIMRTLVLAKELARTNEVFYICKIDKPFSEKYRQGIEKIKNEAFNVVTIDENNVLNELKNISIDCLITDSYQVDKDYFNITKNMFKLTGYIDDMNLHIFNVDFIINQNIGAEEYIYKVNTNTKLFLGTNYIMLREEFRKVPEKCINKEVKDVMITVGGADLNGVTNIVCDYVKDLPFKFHVVIGPAFKEENIEKLIKLKSSKKNINLYFNADMIEIMKRCDIAISACGSTLYELAVLRIPTLGIIIADNQEKTACKMQEKKVMYNLGWYNKLNKQKLMYYINEICKSNTRELMIKDNEIFNKNGVEKLAYLINYMKLYI